MPIIFNRNTPLPFLKKTIKFYRYKPSIGIIGVFY